MIVIGIWIEKGMGLIVPGFIPSPLGEIVEYTPTLNETLICWASGPRASSSTRSSCGSAIPVIAGQLTEENDREEAGARQGKTASQAA
jgi:hypothetical protein